jgi:hypothetical protein
LDLPTVVDFYLYKFDLTCLADGSSWCLLEQDDWVLEALPSVTWPTYTEKTYPDWTCMFDSDASCTATTSTNTGNQMILSVERTDLMRMER